MIKNKKYTHTKGGRIEDFDFDSKNKNQNKSNVSKKYIHFDLRLRDGNIGNFKISQHTFAHFDEFKNVYLNGQIQKFTHIMQYFAVFIFLLNSMKLTEIDFINPDACQGQKTKDDTCYIKNQGVYNLDPLILTIYIKKNVKKSKQNDEIFITSLFEKNDGNSQMLNNIHNIELNNKIKNNRIEFSVDTIKNLLDNQDKIMNNDYNISKILDLMKNDFTDVSTPQHQSPTTPSPSPQPKTSNNQLLPTVYTFSIPKNSGGKKNKTYKNTKYKNHKHKKDKHKKEKGQKDKRRKTRKK